MTKHNREIKHRLRVPRVIPGPESMLHPACAVCVEQHEDCSSRRYISPESMPRLAEPVEPEPFESEASRRRSLMIVETAIELDRAERRAERCYDADGFWRRPSSVR